MQKNREEVREDERLNKAFPLSKHGSQKKYGSKAKMASITSLDLDPALAGQQSCPLPFALPDSNSLSKERTLNPLTHKSAASNLQLHSYVGSMQKLDSAVLDKPSYFFASPQVQKGSQILNGQSEQRPNNTELPSSLIKRSLALPDLPKNVVESGSLHFLPEDGSFDHHKSPHAATQGSVMTSFVTTGGPSDEDSTMKNAKAHHTHARGRLNLSLIVKPGTLNKSGLATDDGFGTDFDENFESLGTVRRLKNLRELSQKRMESNITMSIQRAEQHDSQTKLEKYQHSSQILGKMMTGYKSAQKLLQMDPGWESQGQLEQQSRKQAPL